MCCESNAYMAPWPSGKAKVCKTFIPQFESGWHLHDTARKSERVSVFFVVSGMVLMPKGAKTERGEVGISPWEKSVKQP